MIDSDDIMGDIKKEKHQQERKAHASGSGFPKGKSTYRCSPCSLCDFCTGVEDLLFFTRSDMTGFCQGGVLLPTGNFLPGKAGRSRGLEPGPSPPSKLLAVCITTAKAEPARLVTCLNVPRTCVRSSGKRNTTLCRPASRDGSFGSRALCHS